MIDINKLYLYEMLKSISQEEQITAQIFTSILELYNVNVSDYNKFIQDEISITVDTEDEEYLQTMKEVFHKDDRNYFTISSKEDFSNLVKSQNNTMIKRTLIYTPLNDHSRNKLSKGDILFCYRQGQFSSLTTALETRGIYAVGFAASDPMEIFQNESGYLRYGIVVYFPILLNNHLQLRNIQMHPKTIDLTPYNGNRNDALQYIEREDQYETLMGLICEVNPELKSGFEEIRNQNIESVVLPDVKWKENKVESETIVTPIEFDIDSFKKSLDESGLIYSKEMIVRFVGSLCTKPFVILTGLSGSGKTQLALNFARWICNEHDSKFQLLKEALNSEEILDNYKIKTFSKDIVELINIKGSSGKIIPIPTNLIYEWYEAVKVGIVDETTDPKEIRHIIGEESVYQRYIHGFYNELNKISIVMNSLKLSEVELNIIKQYEIVPVGAEWTNREPLLGFPNALQSDKYESPDNGILDLLINANNNPDLPFFLILDEMNLSHVERYFSDFLSVMESGEKISLYDESEKRLEIPSSISLPNNLFIIGTVNIDETTYMFSPKVLDRANTIEFRINKNEMKEFLDNKKELNLDKLKSKGANMSSSFLNIARDRNNVEKDFGKHNDILLKFFKELSKVGSEFGYRSISEIHLLIKQLSIIDNTINDNEILDIGIMQKILPKLHGSRRTISPILKILANLCVESGEINIERDILNKDIFEFKNSTDIKYPLSLEKISRMYRSAIDSGYTSYSEA